MVILKQFINYFAIRDRAGNTTVFFIIEKGKETVLVFSQGKVKVLWDAILFKCVIEWFNYCQYNTTQYNSLNVKLSNSQLNKLKSAIKNEAEVDIDSCIQFYYK